MASSSSTTTTSTRLSCEEKRMIKVLLLQGQKSAQQLQILLLHNNRDHDQSGFATAADAFVDQILTSFTETIHRIDHHKSKKRSPGTSSTTTSSTTPSNLMMMDKRGCYKRRRCSETRTKVSPTMEDGQAWRKYGQKVILNSNFPRSYFRCTHKYDQGCKATKQVQAMEDNPQLYQTTYVGFHTCTSHTLPPPLKPTAPTLFSETPNYNQHNVVKEEVEHNPNNKEQDTMSDLTDNLNSSSSFPGQLLHMDFDHVSQMYSFGPAFDDVTSQFDHPDFKIDDFFLFDDHFTPHGTEEK